VRNKYFWWIIGGISTVVVLYVLIRMIVKYAPQSSITDDIKVEKSNLTFPEAQYPLFADQLFNAMDGAGTDEDAVVSVVLKMKNADDWNMLVKSYGTRTLQAFWITTHEGTLLSALRSELGASDIKKINDHLATFNTNI
jgi:hypothetical protein